MKLILPGRILAAHQGCELTILDSDSDLPPPDLVSPGGPTAEIQNRIAVHSKLYGWTVLHGRIFRLLRDSTYLSQEEMEKVDDRIQAQYEKMPVLLSYNTDSGADPAWYLDNQIFVHNTRFRLFRHNLTPNAPMPARLAALRSCIELAKDISSEIGKKFKDDLDPGTRGEVYEYNRRVARIILPEHSQFLSNCAMFLIAAKVWTFALPYIIALRVIANKIAINKCCCRYLWGVILFTEDKDSVLHDTEKDSELEYKWTEADEEIVALIAADMHQDSRAWEAVWLKPDPNLRALDVSPGSLEMELEQSDDVASTSETSETRWVPGAKSPVAPEGPGEPPSKITWERDPEDETWDAMLTYVRARCEEQGIQEPLTSTVNIDSAEGLNPANAAETNKDIQRRMSIANFL
jgi:hypothetical protein